jgi:hypothetical protein
MTCEVRWDGYVVESYIEDFGQRYQKLRQT